MKRIILTILVIVPLFAGAQNVLIRHKTGVIGFQTGLINTIKYEDESLLLFDRMPDELSTTDKNNINTAIKRLIDSNLWNKIYVLQVFAQNTYFNSLPNWKGDYSNATVVDTSQFSEGTGWMGDYTNHYVNTNYSHNDFTLMSATDNQLCYYSRNIGLASNAYISGGMYTGSTSTSSYWIANSSTATVNGRYAGISFSSAQSAQTGFVRMHISNDTLSIENEYEAQPINRYTGITGVFSSSNELYLNARNFNGTPTAYDAVQFSMFSASKSMSAKQYADFKAIMNDYFDSQQYWEYASIVEYGAESGNSDNLTEIQQAIDSEENVYFGKPYETFTISQPISLDSGNYIINSELKIKDGSTRLLTADVLTGVNVVSVTDANTYFTIGDYVSVSDENRDLQGGGTGQTRYVADAFRVTDVDATTVTLNLNTGYDYTTAANAQIGHTQSTIIIDSCENVTIAGDGIVNANKDNQYDVEPVIPNTSEDVYHGCAITVNNADSIYISGVKVKNSILHGVNSKYVDEFIYQDMYATTNHDKGFLVWYSNDGIIDNCIVDSSEYEDGIICYLTSDNIEIKNCSIDYCARSGIWINSTITNTNIHDNYITNSGTGMYIANSTTLVNDNYMQATGAYLSIVGATKRYVMRLYNLDGITMSGNVVAGGNDGYGAVYLSECDNIILDDFEIFGTSGSTNEGYGLHVVGTSGNCDNVTLQNSYLHDNKQNFEIDADCGLTQINNIIE